VCGSPAAVFQVDFFRGGAETRFLPVVELLHPRLVFREEGELCSVSVRAAFDLCLCGSRFLGGSSWSGKSDLAAVIVGCGDYFFFGVQSYVVASRAACFVLRRSPDRVC
jgi:hypothetical protein